MLSGHQSNPGGETAARRERSPIPNLGNQRGSDDRANAGDFLQPPAFFTRPVPGVDVFLDRSDLGRYRCILASQNIEAQARSGCNPIVLLVSDDLEQFRRAIAECPLCL
jgi:hypothetical protein